MTNPRNGAVDLILSGEQGNDNGACSLQPCLDFLPLSVPVHFLPVMQK